MNWQDRLRQIVDHIQKNHRPSDVTLRALAMHEIRALGLPVAPSKELPRLGHWTV